jgi:hypothetical protein
VLMCRRPYPKNGCGGEAAGGVAGGEAAAASSAREAVVPICYPVRVSHASRTESWRRASCVNQSASAADEPHSEQLPAAIKHKRCERTSVERGSVKRASVERAGVERASVEQAAASARAGELQGEHGSSELQSAASCNKRAPQPMTTTALPNCGRRRTAVRARRASAPFDDVDGAGRMAPLSCDV